MSPLERLRHFFESINRNDGDALLASYEPDAVLSLAPNGGIATGTDQLREALAAFLPFEMSFTDERELISADGQLALTSLRWKAAGTGPDGEPVTMEGTSTEVFRRQADGEWLLVLDSPWWAS
jgi:ketosteroid isomerase-like protein